MKVLGAARFLARGEPAYGGELATGKGIGAARFELATSCTRNKRATRLRYAPILDSRFLNRFCYLRTATGFLARGEPAYGGELATFPPTAGQACTLPRSAGPKQARYQAALRPDSMNKLSVLRRYPRRYARLPPSPATSCRDYGVTWRYAPIQPSFRKVPRYSIRYPAYGKREMRTSSEPGSVRTPYLYRGSAGASPSRNGTTGVGRDGGRGPPR